MQYRAKDGDVLDKICLAHYGVTGVVPQVLEANPGLAARGPLLSAGVIVELPVLAAVTVDANTVRLWG